MPPPARCPPRRKSIALARERVALLREHLTHDDEREALADMGLLLSRKRVTLVHEREAHSRMCLLLSRERVALARERVTHDDKRNALSREYLFMPTMAGALSFDLFSFAFCLVGRCSRSSFTQRSPSSWD